VLLETSAFADFLVERIPVLQHEWDERRTQLVAEGKLPDTATNQGREGA